MAYTPATVAQVRVILPATTKLEDPQIQASIDAAVCVVDTIALGCAAGLTEACLTQVHIYLSAHYCAATEFTLNISSESDKCSGSTAKYGWDLGKGVMGSPFGQLANTISGGCLAELDKQPARLFSIGCI